tara:strand:+ start:5163 stop:5624 length:462 start_codon:yes stop_codon:yes gene_type:complete
MDTNQIKLFSSKKTDNWQTPPELYKWIDSFYNFDFDPCPLNSKFNGLIVDWKKRNFVNPPYSNITAFLKKAHKELCNDNAEICVFLTFANTDTNWFHNWVLNYGEIIFIKGRIKFLNENGKKNSNAMRPSILIILKKTLNMVTNNWNEEKKEV